MKHVFIIPLTLICLSGCSQKTERIIVDSVSSDNVKYISFQTDQGYQKTQTTFGLFDSEETLLSSVTIQTPGEISYDEYDARGKVYYCYGTGGICSIDMSHEHPVISVLSEGVIGNVAADETGTVYMYYNNGIQKNGEYSAVIRTEDEEIYSFGLPLYSMFIENNNLYLETMNLHDDSKFPHKIITYDISDKKVKSEYVYHFENGVLYPMMDSIFILSSRGIYDIKTKKAYSFREYPEGIDLSYTRKDAFVLGGQNYLIHRDGTSRIISHLALSDNVCILEEVFRIEDGVGIEGISSFNEDSVILVNNNQYIRELKFNPDGTIIVRPLNLDLPVEYPLHHVILVN